MASKEVKDLFWKWSREVLQEERFKQCQDLEKGAYFIRENPTKWKKIHTQFINALFQKNEETTKRILQQPHGKEKLIELYNIKNVDGFEWLKS